MNLNLILCKLIISSPWALKWRTFPKRGGGVPQNSARFFHAKKTPTICDIFVLKLRMGDVLLIYFEQIVSLLCSHQLKKKLKLFCKNSSLNSANLTDMVIFCIFSFYSKPKIFYTSGTRDKFHVCKQYLTTSPKIVLGTFS